MILYAVYLLSKEQKAEECPSLPQNKLALSTIKNYRINNDCLI
jgi:hypothetical protein